MRRARFARAVESIGGTPGRVSIGEALWFDLRAPETQRRGFAGATGASPGFDARGAPAGRHAPPDHGRLRILARIRRGSGLSTDNPLIPAGLALALDAAAASALFLRKRLNLPAHTIVRGLCVYVGAVGAVVDLVRPNRRRRHVRHADRRCTDRDVRRDRHGRDRLDPVAAADHLTNMIVVGLCRDGAVELAAHRRSRWSSCRWRCVAYSVAGTRGVHRGRPQAAQPRRRGAQGAQLRRRVRKQRPRLVLGDQLPRHPFLRLAAARRRLPLRARGAARPPVHRPAVGRHGIARQLREERKTLGFHLSARFPFSDVIVRAGERRGHSLVAVGQSDLRRARPLPRLPRHRHRPHRAAPLRAGNHAARALRLADRPAQPGDDAPDARRSAAQRVQPPEGLRPVPDRSRPLQERQRHARPSGRRRPAPPGRGPAEAR